jgi:hypothetical protein
MAVAEQGEGVRAAGRRAMLLAVMARSVVGKALVIPHLDPQLGAKIVEAIDEDTKRAQKQKRKRRKKRRTPSATTGRTEGSED